MSLRGLMTVQIATIVLLLLLSPLAAASTVYSALWLVSMEERAADRLVQSPFFATGNFALATLISLVWIATTAQSARFFERARMRIAPRFKDVGSALGKVHFVSCFSLFGLSTVFLGLMVYSILSGS